MEKKINHVSDNAMQSLQVARNSVLIAAGGADVVKSTIHGMNTIREQIHETSKRIKRLGESSQEIGGFVSLINNIADHTNTLALNAAIQATMAGDAGKGFGVVAVDDTDRVIEFAEKPSQPKHMPGDETMAFASMGIYIFNAKFLYEQVIRDADEPHSGHDFGGDIIPYLIKKYKVQAHRFTDSCVGARNNNFYWRDVGTIDAYWEANMELTKVIPELNL